MSALAAALALAAAWAAGAWWPLLALAALLWLAAWRAPGIARWLLLLLAPILVAASVRAHGVTPSSLALGLGIGALAAAPLVLELGWRAASRRAALVAGGALGLALLATLSPLGARVVASDLGVGVFVALLAIAALALTAGAREPTT